MFEGKTWTYKQFFDDFTRVGNWLIGLGIEVGELVAVDGGNSPEYLLMWFALDAIGACPSFINCNLKGASLEHCVRLCKSRFIFADSDIQHLVDPSIKEFESSGVSMSINLSYVLGPAFRN